MKTKRINVRVTEKEKEALTEIAARLGIPEAIIVRDAVKEKIDECKKQNQFKPALAAA